MSPKERLHQMVEELPEAELHTAQRFLEYLCDPLLRELREAPVDDEPTTPDEDRGTQEAWAEYERGESRSWKEVRKELAGE